jgi:hypothetical protein
VSPSWHRRLRQGRRERLAQDIQRVQGYMAAVLTDARRLDAPDNFDAATAISIWRNWSVKVQEWAERDQ